VRQAPPPRCGMWPPARRDTGRRAGSERAHVWLRKQPCKHAQRGTERRFRRWRLGRFHWARGGGSRGGRARTFSSAERLKVANSSSQKSQSPPHCTGTHAHTHRGSMGTFARSPTRHLARVQGGYT
jgi:hypothetical protein